MTFKFVIHPEATGGYWAEVPALPGCYPKAKSLTNWLPICAKPLPATLEVLPEEGRSPDPEVEVGELAL